MADVAMRRQRPCTRPHGTVARYAAGCSCFECCEAWRFYQRDYRAGEGRSVDGDPARRLIAYLERVGHSRRAIAEGSGLSYRTLRAIESGESKRVHADTMEALKSYRHPPTGSSALVPAEHTRHLLALITKRMTAQAAADALGVSRRSLTTASQRCVQYRTQERAERLALLCGATKHPADVERYDLLRADGLTPEQAAGVMGMSTRTAWRIEARNLQPQV
jgi:hypothetical protein